MQSTLFPLPRSNFLLEFLNRSRAESSLLSKVSVPCGCSKPRTNENSSWLHFRCPASLSPISLFRQNPKRKAQKLNLSWFEIPRRRAIQRKLLARITRRKDGEVEQIQLADMSCLICRMSSEKMATFSRSFSAFFVFFLPHQSLQFF